MSKASKIILGIVVLLFISVFVKFTYKDFYYEIFRSQECWSERNAKESHFYGKVTKMYVDPSDHNFNTMIVEDNHHLRYIVVLSDNEELALYDTININDSIRKDANSLRFYLKRNKSNKTDTILVKYNCK